MTEMRAMVTGAEGQLGAALTRLLGDRVAWSGGRAELDVTDPDRVAAQVAEVRPDVVINAAAYNAVDAAEDDPVGAFAVNAFAPLYLASAAGESGAAMVHVSTDYVFDGAAARAYLESDAPAPLSVYAASKLAGENLVEGAGGAVLVVRTSGVFGRGGSRAKRGSFPERILARARAGDPLRVVDDQVLSPTYAPDLAAAIVALVERGALGLVHVTNSGETSWHGLAVATLELSGVSADVATLTTAELGAAARRPAYSVLGSERLEGLGVGPLRSWRDALGELLDPEQEPGGAAPAGD